VNADTAALVRRPYLEIVDDLLTAIVGGVVNEPILFDVKSDRYPLSRPASALRSVTGTHGGEQFTFQQTIDYAFSAGDNAVGWLPDANHPDDNTTFFVDYLVPGSVSPLTDVNVGSVTRTLAEAIGREIATVYEQINAAYRSGFVDTATGTSLELVVSIVGVHRKTKDFAQGLVTFFRDATSTGAITIPAGTLLVAATPQRPQFETSETRTLQPGTARIDVPVRATEEFKGEVSQVPAGSISELVVLLDGIARVSNLDTTFLGAEDESDDDLRLRAKAALRAISKGTQAALEQAVLEERAKVLEVWDPNAPPDRRTDPGRVALLVEADPKRFPSLLPAVHAVRAAGVELTLVARYVYLTLRVRGTIAPGLPPAGRDKIVSGLRRRPRERRSGRRKRAPVRARNGLRPERPRDRRRHPAPKRRHAPRARDARGRARRGRHTAAGRRGGSPSGARRRADECARRGPDRGDDLRPQPRTGADGPAGDRRREGGRHVQGDRAGGWSDVVDRARHGPDRRRSHRGRRLTCRRRPTGS
jgi:hypothetical protein